MIGFKPKLRSTQNINVGSTPASVQLSAGDGPLAVRIFNEGTATAWITFGGAKAEASSANSVPIGAGVTEVLTAQSNETGGLWVSAVAIGATGKIYFTPGEGI